MKAVEEASEVLDTSHLHPAVALDRPSCLVEPRYRSWVARDGGRRLSTWEKLHHQKIAPCMSVLPRTAQGRYGTRENLRKLVRRFASNRTAICTSAIFVLSGMLAVDLCITIGAQKDRSLWTEPLKQRYLNLNRRNQSLGNTQPIFASSAHGHTPKPMAIPKRGTDLSEKKKKGIPTDIESEMQQDADSDESKFTTHLDNTDTTADEEYLEATLFRGESDAKNDSDSALMDDATSDNSAGDDSNDQDETVSAVDSATDDDSSPAEEYDREETRQTSGDNTAVAMTSENTIERMSNRETSDSKIPRRPKVTKTTGAKVHEGVGHSRLNTAKGRKQRSVDDSAVPKITHRPSIRNGTMYEIPASWSRFFVPWFVPHQTFKLKSVAEARNRILYAPTKHMMSDGIGHSMASLNYEIRVAHGFGLAYSHRVSMYSSLSVNSPLAVEDFFGWGEGVPMLREQIMRRVCRSEYKNDREWAVGNFERRFDCNTCASIRPGNNLGVDKLVELPTQLCIKCVGGRPYRSGDLCARERLEYIKQHNDSNTLFQLPVKDCASPVSDAQFGDTKHYFFHKYWEKHAFPKPLSAMMNRGAERRNITRTMNLAEHELNIAVHVRRGDFFNPEVRIKRKMFTDKAYASLICRMLQVAADVGGVFAELPVRIHIFSEGRVMRIGISSHSVSTQDHKYYDFNGAARDAGWWERLIAHTARQELKNAGLAGVAKQDEAASLRWKDAASMESVLKRLSVRLRISEPTLASMHEMASADLFIGSKSGLSTNAVWALTRGVSLLPSGAPVNSEGMAGGKEKNRICCTVSFDPDTFDFDASKLVEYWRAYTAANGNSARAAVAAKAASRE